jgi:hypothetical protein
MTEDTKNNGSILSYDLNEMVGEDYLDVKRELCRLAMEEGRKDEHVIIRHESLETPAILSIAEAVISMCMLLPFNQFGFDAHPQFLFRAEPSPSNINKHFNMLIESFKEIDDVDIGELNDCIADMIQDISDIASEYNVVRGNSISLYEIFNLADQVPEFDDLLNFTIPDGLQFNEIENLVDQKVTDFTRLLSESDTVISHFVNCGAAINIKQMGQTFVNVGLKPDLDGRIIPDPINTNFLRGMRGVKDFYTNMVGARKALITNHKQVRKAGYLARKLILLVVDTMLDGGVDDCGGENYIPADVRSEDVLSRISGRYTQDGVHITEDRKDLIGTTVKLRGPTTCSHTKVCRKCYGDLAKVNAELHAGILGVLILTAQLTQRLLSSKHLLQTRSDLIEFNDAFNEFFLVDRAVITAASNVDKVKIDPEMITECEESGNYYITKFESGIKGNWTKIESPVNLYLAEPLAKAFRESGTSEIVADPNDMREGLFFMQIDNNELSASLQAILDLIEKTDHLGNDNIIDIYNTFTELLEESGLTIQSIHIEMILRALTRDINDKNARPDFATLPFPEHQVLTVKNAILNSPTSVSMVFEEVKKQFADPITYTKESTSVLDPLFLN